MTKRTSAGERDGLNGKRAPSASASTASPASVVRRPAEQLHARELHALAAHDAGPRPDGWRLSPRAVRTFIVGSDDRALTHDWDGETAQTVVRRKFYGDDGLVERAIVTLAGNRGLLLVGEPGTAKSMLSELLAAAISGNSTLTIQGSAGTTEDQLKHSWNYARLLAEGPTLAALVPAPLYLGLRDGAIVRFEEMTRCQQEIQDLLVSVLSDKVLHIPELGDPDGVVLARRGFNLLATANLRDRGVHEMSSALKRRFNFETVRAIADRELEIELVREQTHALLREADAHVRVQPDVIELLVTTFRDLRSGRTDDGAVLDRPSTILSTAEAVAVGFAAALDARYFGDGVVAPAHVARQLVGTVLKDEPDDVKKVQQYFQVVVKSRGRSSPLWKAFFDARRWLDRT